MYSFIFLRQLSNFYLLPYRVLIRPIFLIFLPPRIHASKLLGIYGHSSLNSISFARNNIFHLWSFKSYLAWHILCKFDSHRSIRHRPSRWNGANWGLSAWYNNKICLVIMIMKNPHWYHASKYIHLVTSPFWQQEHRLLTCINFNPSVDK